MNKHSAKTAMDKTLPNAIESPAKRSFALKVEIGLKLADTLAKTVLHGHWKSRTEDRFRSQDLKQTVTDSNRNGEKGLRESRAGMENTYGKTALRFRFQSAA